MRTLNIKQSSGYAVTGILLLMLVASSPASAQTEWSVGISGGNEGIDGFTFSIGQYYGVPESEVCAIYDRGIYEEELPVVFFIARMAHVHPRVVVDLRLRGMSWMDITYYYGLRPDIYYVPVVVHHYVPAYGYYHHHPRSGWKRGDLRDRDIVNQVNLKFMSEHHRYAPEKIMRYRNEGRSFRVIDRDISHERNVRVVNKRQNSSYQNEQRVNQNRQNIVRPNQPRPVQNMARPSQNRPAQNVARPIESRQKQDFRKGNNQHRYVQNGKGIGTRWNGN